MKIISWQFLGLLFVIFSGLLVSESSADFTVPPWPPFTEGDHDFTVPDWPPNTETDELVTQPGDTTTTPNPGGTTQSPGENEGDSTAWMVTAIIFIVLTVILAILTIYLYVSMPFRRSFRPGQTFKLPRVNP